METVYNKLVRDRIPEIIKNNGEEPITRILSDEEYRIELEKKLLEEYKEVLAANTSEERIGELADILEVLRALAGLENKSLEEIIELANKKAEKRGAFKDKIFLEKTIDNKLSKNK